MKKLTLIKFGGSLITDKTKTNVARLEVIKNLAWQLKSSSAKASEDEASFIIATGAGGFGHPVAKKYENNLEKGLPFIKEAVKKINGIVVDALNNQGLKAESVEPSGLAQYKEGKMVSLLHGYIVSLLEQNIIPIFHADLIDDKKLGTSILSMDRFLVDVAIQLKNNSYDVGKVIFCGTTNGVIDDQGKIIDKINKENFPKLDKYFFKNNQVDTSGGMKGKVFECLRLIDEKISCQIIDGQKENNLSKAILDKVVKGTSILE